MRILHVLDHSIPLHSGYTFRTRAILEQQRVFGWQTFHVTSAKHEGADVLQEEVDGFRFYRTLQARGMLDGLPACNQFAVVNSLAKRIGEVVEEVKPDIIHAHSPALDGLAALRVAQWCSLPVVYECRAFWEDAAVDHGTARENGLRYRITKALETHVFKRANAVITICEGLRDDIIRRGIPKTKITVIPNAVDIKRFGFGREADPQLQATLHLTNKTVIGFIGSFYAYEGLLLLLEALPEIVRWQPNTRLLLVGGGPQESLLKSRTEELSLADKVIFAGRVPHDQVQKYYDLVDIFVYPRLSMRLTELVTPLKPLEAMAQGKLVVASNVGGHRELIQDGKTGILFNAGSGECLVKAVLALLNNPATWSEMQHAERHYVEQQRTWSLSVADYKAVYESLVP